MKANQVKTLVAALLATALSSQAWAEPVVSNTATVEASVKIIKPVSISASGSFNFGQVLDTSGNGGIVQLSTNGVLGVTEGNLVLSGASSRPTFRIEGEPNASVLFEIPWISYLNNAEGGDPIPLMLIASVGPSAVANAFYEYVTLDNAGQAELMSEIGANLLINPNQALGTYSANVNATVVYQ